ncbi:AMP-binding protein [Simiduia aestuariiviva]|uniref:Long-subunit acyl-CoA synthetase (AMP-forming) n=1 Tax=Simiduia aestuariiviva TaxID=1510459 RepID=A0A839UKA4_9GAMM|nr:AMP-binding protein [Simiduia aestuariiviva]MBB3167040.1 long-subunit acyl-CoA synthetase (AMP-forming) [Simiduia aestuariiviva]
MEYLLPLAQFQQRVARHPNKVYLHQPVNRQWRQWTWQQADREARTIASGLLNHFAAGDKIAILAKNSAEWFMADLAIQMAGMVSVPIYATAGAETIEYVLAHSEAKAVFLGKLDDTRAAESAIPASVMRIAFPYPTASAEHQWQEWLTHYEPVGELPTQTPDAMFTLVYTSGSTGQPKGVVLSCKNVGSSSHATAAQSQWYEDDRCISYLPLAHITERCVLEIMTYYSGAAVYFVESLDTFVDDVKHARPNFFISVPRLWTKFQSGILAKIPDQKLQRLLKIPVVGWLVARKIRAGLGLNHARLLGSGSAPIAPAMLEWYRGLGMNIAEGWGMTETSGLSCSNLPYRADRIGTIGVPVPCVEMRLGEGNEVQIRGDAVFKSYYKNPEATAEAFLDGWFRTGDRGEQTADGAFKIVGRLKEQFKTAKGKYVAPAPIENLMARNEWVEQCCVLGVGRPQPVALVVLNEAGQKKTRADVERSLQVTLAEINGELESHERLGGLIVLTEAWTIENGLLTPTLKIRRGPIEEQFIGLLDRMGEATLVWQRDL